MEHQPPASNFPGVTVIHAPNDDDFSRLPTRDELRLAIQAARQAVPILQGGGKVLSTCYMGLNRSGLVSALTLHLWLGVSGDEAIQMVRRGRKGSMRNPGFQTVLSRLSRSGA
jgi:protein-tyrosine phosphatase